MTKRKVLTLEEAQILGWEGNAKAIRSLGGVAGDRWMEGYDPEKLGVYAQYLADVEQLHHARAGLDAIIAWREGTGEHYKRPDVEDRLAAAFDNLQRELDFAASDFWPVDLAPTLRTVAAIASAAEYINSIRPDIRPAIPTKPKPTEEKK